MQYYGSKRLKSVLLDGIQYYKSFCFAPTYKYVADAISPTHTKLWFQAFIVNLTNV